MCGHGLAFAAIRQLRVAEAKEVALMRDCLAVG